MEELTGRVERAERAALEAQRLANEAQQRATAAGTTADAANACCTAGDKKMDRVFEKSQQK